METKEITIEPKVDSAQEFIEIALDFSNPLDLVREAISNAFDAEADNIVLEFSVIQEYGEKVLKIEIEDNGTGMDEKGLASFFDLGNSLRRGDENSIGEKGHGTKVFFNSRKIEVITVKDEKKYHAVMNEPSRELFERRIPKVKVTIDDDETVPSGTSICIWGYKVDLIRGEGDTVEIVDFKSEKKPDVLIETAEMNRYRRQLEVYAHLIEEKTGKKVSKMHLYYTGEDNGVPTVTFNKSTEMIDKTIKEFDEVVEKIQHKDFSGRAKDKNLCANCDMRHYCRRKGDC